MDNFRCAHPDVTESQVKRIVRQMISSVDTKAPGKATSPETTASNSVNSKTINDLRTRTGQLVKSTRVKCEIYGTNGGPGKNHDKQQYEKSVKFEC